MKVFRIFEEGGSGQPILGPLVSFQQYLGNG